MSIKVFVDGGAGTTGIEIVDRLSRRGDVALTLLSENDRKNPLARGEALSRADIGILCLPDEGAREAVMLAAGMAVRFIDASTAHRTDPAWTYGFAELEPGGREGIAGARFVSNPGCYPTGFLALVRPLVRAGLLPIDAVLSVNAVSGYSGGGKAMIAEFESGATDAAWRSYGLALAHKHVAEMRVHGGLAHVPIFAPAVARVYRGMVVEVPLHAAMLAADATPARVHAAIADAYAGSALVRVASLDEAKAMTGLTIEQVGDTDRLDLFVFANADTGYYRLAAALDNLGKGASGAAVQNLNLMAGLPETDGLRF